MILDLKMRNFANVNTNFGIWTLWRAGGADWHRQEKIFAKIDTFPLRKLAIFAILSLKCEITRHWNESFELYTLLGAGGADRRRRGKFCKNWLISLKKIGRFFAILKQKIAIFSDFEAKNAKFLAISEKI